MRERQKGPAAPVLVCAYDDEEKCRAIRLPGSITIRELNTRLDSVPREQEIVFYCA